jgi:hypothetical protein
MPISSRLFASSLLLLLAGCGSTPHLTPPTGSVPDLRGVWTGTWGGTLLTLLVLKQEDQESTSGGVTVGPWALAGQRLPGVSGVLTYTVRGQAVSVNVWGPLGDWNGTLTLVLHPETPNGQQIVLTRVDEGRLTGAGTSPLSWDPQGPVDLVRQAPGGGSGARP